MYIKIKHILVWVLVGTATLITGCSTVEAVKSGLQGEKPTTDPQDPFEAENRLIYEINHAVDYVFLQPVARTYSDHTPQPVQSCIANIFSNLLEPVRFVAHVITLDDDGAITSGSRFATNTLVGGLGCVDSAQSLGIEKDDTDLGLAARYWLGGENSPYIVIPLAGPSTLIDGAGSLVANQRLDPIRYPHPYKQDGEEHRSFWSKYNPYGINDPGARQAVYGVRVLDTRAQLLDTTDFIDTAAIDPYLFVRDAYLEQRAAKAEQLKQGD